MADLFAAAGDQENRGGTSPDPIYYDVHPRTVLALRIYAGVVAFLVFLALIFCFVKGANDSVMYLLACNMIMSSLIGIIIAWWYHKGVIEPDKILFMVFVGVCIIFQAITSDIFVYRRPSTSPINPATAIPTINTTALPIATTKP
ncbi:uncharacterized protein LOC116608364 [Nematostella vectensis]|uniref:uncharacterized protein LOC116608364 n=1 Tax=Nematostella vectensis TaxID=45351 RepID=UPI00138FB90D|nr:uncharacterized protein LOC116608364 [Nematostella vectensis]